MVNQGTISGGNDYLEIIGAYYADGGSTTNQAELGGCALYETASPSSASTIMIAGNGDVLETDNLSGYTIWVNGNGLFNTDATLNLGANVTNENGGTILLQSSNNTYQSNIATGSYTLTNVGTITAEGGSGGNRIISGTLDNQGTIAATGTTTWRSPAPNTRRAVRRPIRPSWAAARCTRRPRRRRLRRS